jgi:GNAT superfamily N-acetyltransferase
MQLTGLLDTPTISDRNNSAIETHSERPAPLGIQLEQSDKPRGLTDKDFSGISETPMTRSKSDEGYESGTSEKSLEAPIIPSTPSRFQLVSQVQTSKKTQHFAKNFIVFAYSGKQEAGTATARYIDRSLLNKSRFYKSMEELNGCNSDGLAFAKALFSSKGTLMSKHKSSKNKYLGPWSRELETGGLLILKYLLVEKYFRRQGFARLLIDELIKQAKERTAKKPKGKVRFMIVFPAVIKPDFEEELEGKTDEEKVEIEKRAYENAVKFYRAHGFRRIGLSRWFGYALDPEHASRRISAEDDLDP